MNPTRLCNLIRQIVRSDFDPRPQGAVQVKLALARIVKQLLGHGFADAKEVGGGIGGFTLDRRKVGEETPHVLRFTEDPDVFCHQADLFECVQPSGWIVGADATDEGD